MKKIFLILLSFFALFTKAQVKFTLENVKNKSANVVYIGEVNTFKIIASQEISVTNITPSQGNVRMNTDGSFSLYVHELSEKPVELKYTQTMNGVETEVIYPTKYMVKKRPSPFQIKMGAYTKSGAISLVDLKKNYALEVIDIETRTAVNDLTYSCEVFVQPIKGDPRVCRINSSRKVQMQMCLDDLFKHVNIGDRIFVEKIQVISQNGNTVELEPLIITVK